MSANKFKVGDKVKSLIDLSGLPKYSIGKVTSFHSYYIYVSFNSPKTIRFFQKGEIELVIDKPVSKRVRVTFEADVNSSVYPNTPKGYVRPTVNGAAIYLDDLDDSQIEYLPDPIVLPTKKHSLAIIRNIVYYGNGEGKYNYDYGRVINANQMQKRAEDAGSEYRVIFEGED